MPWTEGRIHLFYLQKMGILKSCLVGFTSLKGVHLGRMIAPGVNGDICRIGVNHNPPGSKIK